MFAALAGAEADVPAIHFGVDTGELLPLLAKAGAGVVGVDWRVPLDEARARLGPDIAVQGNLDPAACLAPWPAVEERARDVLRRNAGRPGHIFNLGHGVLPETDPSVLERLVELVHALGARAVNGPGPGRSRAGLVVMAYGTPRSPDEVEAYYTHIRRGRPPAPEQLADLVRRYDAIGGLSPLAARTAAQLAGIAGALEAAEPGRWAAEPGNKHAAPFVEDAVGAPGRRRRLADRRAGAGAALLAGVGRRVPRPGREVAAAGRCWRTSASTRGTTSRRGSTPRRPGCAAPLAGLPADTHVLFTAHSLPERVLAGDPYADELAASAAAIAARVGLPAAPSTTATDGRRRRRGWAAAGRWPGSRRGARPSRGGGPTSSR